MLHFQPLKSKTTSATVQHGRHTTQTTNVTKNQ